MKYRLEEGNGLAFYLVGVEDNGTAIGICESEMEESLGTLFFLACNLNLLLDV